MAKEGLSRVRQDVAGPFTGGRIARPSIAGAIGFRKKLSMLLRRRSLLHLTETWIRGGNGSRAILTNEMNTLELLQDDFKLFLQALWAELDLPSPTRAQYAIADYLQHGPKRLQFKLSVVLENHGSQERSCSGLSLKIKSERLWSSPPLRRGRIICRSSYRN